MSSNDPVAVFLSTRDPTKLAASAGTLSPQKRKAAIDAIVDDLRPQARPRDGGQWCRNSVYMWSCIPCLRSGADGTRPRSCSSASPDSQALGSHAQRQRRSWERQGPASFPSTLLSFTNCFAKEANFPFIFLAGPPSPSSLCPTDDLE
jgi:hypothetical protein